MALAPLVDTGDIARRVESQLHGGRRDTAGRAFQVALLGALALALAVLVILFIDIARRGWPVLSSDLQSFLAGELRSQPDDAQVGIFQGLRGSFWIGVFVLVFAVPTGIAAAIYLEEYAHHGAISRFIAVNIRNLAGVPSIVYGILGLSLFVKATDFFTKGPSIMAAGMTLAVLVLPVIIITSAEAVRAVPQALREGAYGLGATKWDTIRTQVLPYAAPGIITGSLLSLARAIGEAAPILVVGAITGRLATDHGGFFDVGQLTERFTALPIIINEWSSEADKAGSPVQFQENLAPAAAFVLVLIVLLLSVVAILLRSRFEKRRGT